MRNQLHWKLPLFPRVPAHLGLRLLPAELAGSRLLLTEISYFCKLYKLSESEWISRSRSLWSLQTNHFSFESVYFPIGFRRKVNRRCPHVISQMEQEWDLTASMSRVFLVVHVMPQAWAFCGAAKGRKWRNVLIHVSLQAEQKSCGGERMKKAHSGQSSCWLLYHCMQQRGFKKVQHIKWHIVKAWKSE